MPFPTVQFDALPSLTVDQMREVDRVMVEELGIDLTRMMENAGTHLATLAVDAFAPRSVCVLVGPAGNGGGGLTAARHLFNRGVKVTVVPSQDAGSFAGVPRQQLDILHRMEVAIEPEPRQADLVIDALIGYSLSGAPRGRAAELIRWANDAGMPILTLDVPSGLDATTGAAADPCVQATATMTLAMPTTGLRAPEYVGQLFLADISVPPSVYRRFGISVPDLFRAGTIVEVTR